MFMLSGAMCSCYNDMNMTFFIIRAACYYKPIKRDTYKACFSLLINAKVIDSQGTLWSGIILLENIVFNSCSLSWILVCLIG